jgi:hypothetical protein
MTLEFHPEAIAELEAAALHYEATRPGLGARFTDAVEETVQRIVDSPQTWRVVDDDVRRCLTHVLRRALYHRARFHLDSRDFSFGEETRVLEGPAVRA